MRVASPMVVTVVSMGVGAFGLCNSVVPVGDAFLEVVSPLQAGDGGVVVEHSPAHLGQRQISIASYGVGTRLLFFWFTPIIGLGIATATVVGQKPVTPKRGRRAAIRATASPASFRSIG